MIAITKKEWWYIAGGLIITAIGSYIFYHKQSSSTGVSANLTNAVTPVSVAGDLDANQNAVLSSSTSMQAQNVVSALGNNYTNYNLGGTVDLHTGATSGNGNSFTRGVSGQSLYDSQLQLLITSNPLLAPTATAVQSPQDFIDWRIVQNPPLPN